jgi:transaldolase / glucose-6-phosphate isomerase
MANQEATELKTGACKYSLGAHEKELQAKLDEFAKNNAMKMLWRKDASLWSGADEAQWLGWLDIVEQQLAQIQLFKDIAEDTKSGGFTHALLLGMGGSSLCVEVMRETFGVKKPFPEMVVLDSTVPAQVEAAHKAVDLKKTIVIVASKSGSTTEPNVLLKYFYDETKKLVGDKVGQNFVAVTDPGSSMEKTAKDLGFRKVYFGVPSIGGRFSALSNFGMVPSAVMGYDVPAFLERAQKMVEACGPSQAPADNPGCLLGTILGVLALKGRDKVTIVTSPGIASFGAWLEQLFAESTGKEGKGLIPVAGEKLCGPEFYGKDRVFVYVRLNTEPDTTQDTMMRALMSADQPVVFIEMADKLDLGGEFFRFEFATAVAGAVLKINAFNQPNVQESKDFTKRILGEYEKNSKLPEDILLFDGDGIKLYCDKDNKEALEAAVSGKKSVDTFIGAHLSRLAPGDYYATNAYIDRNHNTEAKLQELRDTVMEKHKVATTVGFGPRFLHSTGQLHKGGPNSGVFLQITSDDARDVPIAGEKFTFGILKQAQSLGDFQALSNRHRRLLRVHLGSDVEKGLAQLRQTFQTIFGQRH